MSNALTLFNNVPQLPAELTAFFDEESNIAPKQTVPTLSYEGKTWSIGIEGEKTKLMRKNADGDEEPLSIMRVVVLDYAKRRGRAFYEGTYDPAKVAMPNCWSDDGIKPSPHVKEPKASKCDGCPLSVKGSKVTDAGKATTACSQHRMVVVVPANKLDFTPLRLKLAITSDYDGQSPEQEAQGWFAFSNYTDMVRARNVSHTAQLVTKMKFDASVAYPKVLFSPDRFLTADEVKAIIPVVKSEAVTGLLDGSWSPNGADGTKSAEIPMDKVLDNAVAKEAAAKAAAPDTSAADKAAADAAAKATADKAAKKAAKVKAAEDAAKAAAAAAAAAAADDDDGDGEIVLPGTPAAAASEAAKPVTAAPAKAAAPATPAAVPGDVKALLDDWGDD